MQVVKCKNCGAQLDVSKAVGGVVTCEYCFSKHTLAKSADSSAVGFLTVGENGLDTGRFDDAYTAYGKAAQADGSEPEAYFGMALAAHKVRYIKDIVNNRLQPICYDVTEKRFSADGNYLKALSLASPEQRAEYERRAREIDYIKSEFYKLSSSGMKYDCFICVKVSGEGGSKTVDSERANDIYYHLRDKGYKPFYSEREIQNATGADYEARILYALFSSPCMLVVCSDERYLQTPWVKNEYSRFVSLINDERKEANSIAIGFFDTPIERLPGRNGRLQGVCLNKPDAYSKIVDFVNNCSPSERNKADEDDIKRKLEEQAAAQARQLEEFKRQQQLAQTELREKLAAIQGGDAQSDISVGSSNVNALLANVNRFLDKEDFDNAKKYCERVLDIEPENGEAWMGLLLVVFEAYNTNVLLKKIKERDADKHYLGGPSWMEKDSDEFQNALKYAVNHKALLDEVKLYFDTCYEKYKEEKRVERERREAEEARQKAAWEYAALEDAARKACWIDENGVLNNCEDRNVTELVLPRDVLEIGNFAFSDCKKLAKIYVPLETGKIGSYAFSKCSALKEISVPNVSHIGNGAFGDCTGLTKIVLSGSLREIEDYTFSHCEALAELAIPSGVKKIGNGAFSSCKSLKKVVIPNTVQSIGKWAFSGCDDAREIYIPIGLTDIGDQAFTGCRSCSVLAVEEGNKRYRADGNCLIDVEQKAVTFGGNHSTIPDGGSIETISDYAFRDSDRITELRVPEGVKTLRDGAFFNCTALISIRLPKSLAAICGYAFGGCTQLSEIVIPDGVKSIGIGAFFNCTELKKATMPKRLKKYVKKAFTVGKEYVYGEKYVKPKLNKNIEFIFT